MNVGSVPMGAAAQSASSYQFSLLPEKDLLLDRSDSYLYSKYFMKFEQMFKKTKTLPNSLAALIQRFCQTFRAPFPQDARSVDTKTANGMFAKLEGVPALNSIRHFDCPTIKIKL